MHDGFPWCNGGIVDAMKIKHGSRLKVRYYARRKVYTLTMTGDGAVC